MSELVDFVGKPQPPRYRGVVQGVAIFAVGASAAAGMVDALFVSMYGGDYLEALGFFMVSVACGAFLDPR